MTESMKDKLKNVLEKIEHGAEDVTQEIKKGAGGIEGGIKKDFEKKTGEQKEQ